MLTRDLSQVPLAPDGDELVWEAEEEEPYDVDDADQGLPNELGLRGEAGGSRGSAGRWERPPTLEEEEEKLLLRAPEHARAAKGDQPVLRLRGDGEQGEEHGDAHAAEALPELLALRGKGLRGSAQGAGGDGKQGEVGGARSGERSSGSRSWSNHIDRDGRGIEYRKERFPGSAADSDPPRGEGGMSLRGSGGRQMQEAPIYTSGSRWLQRSPVTCFRLHPHLLPGTHAHMRRRSRLGAAYAMGQGDGAANYHLATDNHCGPCSLDTDTLSPTPC